MKIHKMFASKEWSGFEKDSIKNSFLRAAVSPRFKIKKEGDFSLFPVKDVLFMSIAAHAKYQPIFVSISFLNINITHAIFL